MIGLGRGSRQVYRVYDDEEYLAAAGNETPVVEGAPVDLGTIDPGPVGTGPVDTGLADPLAAVAPEISDRTSPRAWLALGTVAAAVLCVGGLVVAHTMGGSPGSPSSRRGARPPARSTSSAGGAVAGAEVANGRSRAAARRRYEERSSPIAQRGALAVGANADGLAQTAISADGPVSATAQARRHGMRPNPATPLGSAALAPTDKSVADDQSASSPVVSTGAPASPEAQAPPALREFGFER